MSWDNKEKKPLTNLRPNRDALRVMPLGGLGEIGMNCTIFEYDGEMILVDCGQMMPDEEMLGVDYVIPDISYVRERADKLKGIVLTHAHEDHIGGLPYILPQLPSNIPIYGSELTVTLLREKHKEHGLHPKLAEVKARQPFKVGQHFEITPMDVTHSIMNAFGFAIRTPVGVVIHTGDFKIDPSPTDGVPFDHFSFAQFAEQGDGVLLLMSDSTNVERKGTCPSEIEVLPGLARIFREAEGAIIVSCFASSLHRIQNILNLAEEAGRQVVSVGLNMQRNIRIARDLGLLQVPKSYSDDNRDAMKVPRKRRLILCTGSQGEARSSLARVATGGHRDIQIDPGDTVVLSSRIIPGNEKAIFRMINNIARTGAHVIHEGMSLIHVSGHAYRDDMKHVINLTQPRFLLPVHGEYRHLKEHCELGLSMGMDLDEVLLLEDGDCLEVNKNGAKVIGQIPHGRVLVDGKGIDEVTEVVLRDRSYLSQDGMVVVIVGINRETGDIVNGPELITRGFVDVDENAAVLQELARNAKSAIQEVSPQRRTEITELQAEIKRALRQSIKQDFGRFPVILPVVMEV